jgi:hypothetical protein
VSGLEVLTLVIVGVWLAVLTLVVILIVRQIGLITVRLNLVGPASGFESDGPALGAPIPIEVAATVPDIDDDAWYLLLLSSGCSPCKQLAAEMQQQHVDGNGRIVALVPGRDELAQGLVALLPPAIRSIRDPDASALAQTLAITSVPFALRIEGGVVTAKAHPLTLRSVADLVQFMDVSATSGHGVASIVA